MDVQEIARRHGERCQALIDEMRERLGSDYFTKGEDVGFELTPKGRSVVHYGGLSFFHDEGVLVASRVTGGRAEFALVPSDGDWKWARVSLQPAAMQ